MTDCTPFTALKNVDFEAKASAARRDIPQSPSPSLFDRLPIEIISRIFRSIDLWGVSLPPDFSQLPWVLGRVCSRWRSVSRAERFLWGCPNVVPSPHENITTHAIDILPPWLLIDLRLGLRQGDTFKRWVPYLGRCRNMEFEGNLDQYDELWAHLPQDAFVNLKSVSFTLDGSEARRAAPPLDPETLWASTAAQWAMAHKLHDARFNIWHVTTPIAFTLLSTIPLPWHQLKTIYFSMNPDTLNPKAFWMYLRQCRSLTRLELDNSSGEFTFPGVDWATSIELPELRTLQIEGVLSHFLLPQPTWRNLTHLSIYPTSDRVVQADPGDLQHVLELCCTNLEKLVIWCPECEDGESFPRASSARLHFPLLRSLQVSTINIYSLLPSWKLDVYLIDAPNLRELKFNGSPSNLLDATREFGTSLSSVEFHEKMEMEEDKLTLDLHSEVLSTLSPTATFIHMKGDILLNSEYDKPASWAMDMGWAGVDYGVSDRY
ncbi:hypothetical protein H0H87_006889 [Tephrocybe sp. NHM501043]|nr:hypothetical protein H0H87_006889 [Tephrocybe sp. NHM501043]